MMNGVDLQVRCLVFSCMEGSPITIIALRCFRVDYVILKILFVLL